ncbi:MAG: lipopolysaccharide biosynthesis protein [Clostridiaceae bacterium]|mgnify:CR=1 FL=1|nr:lipopolysaccharide biosynthesis protein [Clostridiaceae bacterium]
MELKQFLIMIRKKIVFIILISVLVSITVALGSVFLISPVYEASSTLYIISQKTASEGDVTYNDLLTNQQLVKDYRELIKSKLIVKTALDELKIMDLTPNQLSNRITVSSKNDTRVLEIKVEDTYPVRSAELSNKICEVFISEAKSLAKIDNVNIVDTAEIPETPVKPQPVLYTAIAFIISLMLTLGVFYLLEVINETIKTSEDIETYLDLNVLGTIPSFNIR